MTKNQKGFLVVGAIAALAFVLYRASNPSKTNQIKYLISGNYTSGTLSDLMNMGDDYIKAWYQAAKDSKDSFTVASATYNTKGGTKK
jgi:hypothetical protein